MKHDGKNAGGSGDHQAGKERAGTHDGTPFTAASQSSEYGYQTAKDANDTEPSERLAQHTGKEIRAHIF
jgi:hypothetical protein